MDWFEAMVLLAVVIGILILADLSYAGVRRVVIWFLNRGKKSQ